MDEVPMFCSQFKLLCGDRVYFRIIPSRSGIRFQKWLKQLQKIILCIYSECMYLTDLSLLLHNIKMF